jgi:RNA polymerase sigma-70 factor (ECF subfamily)
LERARQQQPGLEIDAQHFARHVANAMALSASDRGCSLDELRAGDLYLACGCVLGDPVALARFDRLHLRSVKSHVWAIDTSKAELDELRQVLRARLLVRRAGAPPRLAEYSGKGSLAGWVSVAARRMALSRIRTMARERACADAIMAECAAPGADTDLAWTSTRHAGQLQSAIHAALGALEAQQRRLLRLHVIDGLSLSRIAVSHGVSQSTVSRWFDQVRQRVRLETQRWLSAAGLDSAEVAALARALESQLALDISSAL